MKYCPFCGAALLGSAVSFCSECGKPIPTTSQTQTEAPMDRHEPILPKLDDQWEATAAAGEKSQSPDNDPQVKPAGKLPRNERKKKPRRQKKSAKKGKPRKNQSSEYDAPPDPQDDGYDGYYEDVRPLDNGHEKERMDPELIKKIIMVAGGAALIIILAIVMMLLL